MGRKITGYVEWRGGQWQVQATEPDGTRRWRRLDAKIKRGQEELARAVGARVAEAVRRGELVPEEREETASEWFERYYQAAEKG